MAFELPRLPMIGLTDDQMQIYWQQLVEAIEGALNNIQSQVTDIAAALAAATAAQTSANAVKLTDKISASSVVPANVLSATDAGTDATVTVAAHTRLYGDGSQLAVGGHTFTGKAYSTKYAVYYDDTTTADTTPTYHITTTISNAVSNFVSGRHFVGNVTTPASGGGSTTGGVTAGGMDPGDRGDMSTL